MLFFYECYFFYIYYLKPLKNVVKNWVTFLTVLLSRHWIVGTQPEFGTLFLQWVYQINSLWLVLIHFQEKLWALKNILLGIVKSQSIKRFDT